MSITTEQFDDIMKQYDQTRMLNKRLLDERIHAINREIPQLHDIHSQIIYLSLQQARNELLSPDQSEKRDDFTQQMQELVQKKQTLLTTHGYPADYLSPIYSCPDCKDTGYINGKPCQCLLKKESEILYANAQLESILNEENFDTFDPAFFDDTQIDENLSLTPRQNILKLRDVCQDFIRHFNEACDNLIFYGPTGVGKTFLTHCIARELLNQGHSVVYLTSIQLFDMLEKNRFRGDPAKKEDLRQQLDYTINSELLIIDDLGTELINSFTLSELYHFIEDRHLKQRSTILSTNLSFMELHDHYGERIFSRLTGYYNFYKVIGKDLRR